jgi:hypothetical protein
MSARINMIFKINIYFVWKDSLPMLHAGQRFSWTDGQIKHRIGSKWWGNRTDDKGKMSAAVEMRTKLVAEDIWYEGGGKLSLLFFFTWTQYRMFILWCEYPMRLFSLSIYKGNEKMGIRNKDKRGKWYWDTKGMGEWVYRAGWIIMIHILHAGNLLLDASIKSVLLFHLPVTIQSMWVFTQVCSPSGYLSFHQPASPTWSVSIWLSITGCKNGTVRW